MATSEKPKPASNVPVDLLPVIRASGVLTEKQLADVRSKVLQGDYPSDSVALAGRLVRDKLLSEYQARRLLGNKPQGFVMGRYVIVDRIGAGSMGRVYKAHHVMMDRDVAIKIIAPEIVSNEKVVSRFHREMKLVGRLDHPNVIRAFDADQNGQLCYIVMEYAPGLTLNHYLRKGGISPIEMVDYAAQAALGLAHAHDQGVVHRDVKPSNLLLTDDKRLKVLDLGLGVLMEADEMSAFATADGIAVGTVDYMSPEQACGRDVDGRSDLYGLGCSMYHLITGQLPFPGENPIERMGKRINGRHVPITDVRADVPKALVRVIDTLLAPKAQDRYQNATQAAEALMALKHPRPRATRSPEPPPAADSSPDTPPVLAVGVGVPLLARQAPSRFAFMTHRPALTLAFGLGAVLAAFVAGFLMARAFS